MSESQEQSIPPKPELASSVAEANKTKVDKSLQKPKKGISKKQLAQRLIASAVIAANMGISADHVSRDSLTEEPRGVTRELSLQDLENRAEALYQIQIISPKESPEVSFVVEKLKTVEWTREDIGSLTMALDKLPPHFYLPAPYIYRMELAKPSHKPKDWPDELWEKIKQEQYRSVLDLLKGDLGQDF